MGLFARLFGLDTKEPSQEELERRKTEGYTSWNPETGHVYYPPTKPAGLNEYNQYNGNSPLNEPAYGDDDTTFHS